MTDITQLPSPALALALDLSFDEAKYWVEQTYPFVDCYKIPLFLLPELPRLVELIKKYEKKVFLDLKLHDIPNTVALHMKNFAIFEPDIISVHISGGREMLRACVQAGQGKIIPAGVALLTSISPESASGWFGTPFLELLIRWVQAGWEEGLRCFISSAGDLPLLRSTFPKDIYWICPGIRPEGVRPGDQKRFTTPFQALALGANMLVMGRGIYSSPAPTTLLKQIRERFSP
ncbi:MAG: orotidine-5'-phosphate decarboxylase [bacterium JZ-2024 1]